VPGSSYEKDQNHECLFVPELTHCKVQVMLLLHLLQNPKEYGQDRKKGDDI
jgi:hypothetical protein